MVKLLRGAGRPARRGFVLASCWCLAAGAWAQAGATFEVLETPLGTFRNVKVMSVSASAITIRHAGGIAQVPLAKLSPELQARFGFDVEKSAAHDRKVEAAIEAQRQVALERKAAEEDAQRKRRAEGGWARMQSRFGTKADIVGSDLRMEFQALDLGAKNQGKRPSCAIFAILGALEYEHSRKVGQVERFSEDYLIWATRKTSGRQSIAEHSELSESDRALLTAFLDDIGFTLEEVLATLRAYGAATSDEMPNHNDQRMSKIAEPASYVVDNAKNRRRVSSEELPGFLPAIRVENIIHALNAGIPVVVGFNWPRLAGTNEGNLRARDQPTSMRHAVTLVGYTSENGARESVRFIFRNSWGRGWGDDGYGTVEIGYLERYLSKAVVLQVESLGARKAAP